MQRNSDLELIMNKIMKISSCTARAYDAIHSLKQGAFELHYYENEHNKRIAERMESMSDELAIMVQDLCDLQIEFRKQFHR